MEVAVVMRMVEDGGDEYGGVMTIPVAVVL